MDIQETGDSFEDAVVVQEDPTPQNQELAITKFGQSTNLNQMLSDAQVLLDGKFVPSSIKTPQALVSIVKMGQELGMDTMASINNLVVIQGKPTLGIHAIGALLDKAGVEKQTIEDFVPIMGEEGTDNAGKVVDYRTTIRFTKQSRFGGIVTEDVSFTWKDATKMDLTSKDNWKRMPSN